MSKHSPLLRFSQLTKRYEGSTILNKVDLNLYQGEFITILGPSGCGKTTLLRIIAGFEQPDSGDLLFREKPFLSTPPQARPVHMVFQNYALFPHMTVFNNIAFSLHCKKINHYEVKQRVDETLALIKLTNYKNHKPDELSGGQQQRVAIARAIVNKPQILLLDESLSALDYKLRQSMQIELKQLQRKIGITFILVTHSQEEALSISDNIVVMNQGKIEQIGTPREIYENPCNLFVAKFIGDVNIFCCDVLSTTSDTFTVMIENHRFTYSNSHHFEKNDKVNILVRPEDLRIWTTSEITQEQKKTMLKGIVNSVVYKGSTVDLIVTLKSGKVLSATEFFDEDDENLDYSLNEPIWVHWLPGWEMILPYEK